MYGLWIDTKTGKRRSANPILSDSAGKPPPSTFNYRWDTSPEDVTEHIEVGKWV